MNAEPVLAAVTRALARRRLGAALVRPYYPLSELYRVVRDAGDLQLAFMAQVHGVASFEALRARATGARFGAHTLRVAALDDVIRSEQVADRPQDRAVLPVLEATRRVREHP